MKYAFVIQAMVCLGCIVLGFIIGSYIGIGKGNGAVLGSFLGFILYCLLNWLWSRWFKAQGTSGFLPGSKQALDETAGLRSAQEIQMQAELHARLKSD